MGGEWASSTVGEVSKRVTKGTTPTTIGGRFVETGVAFVKVESITDDGGFDKAKFAFIDDQTNLLLARSVLEEDDILFTIAGTIGRVARVPRDILPANTNQAVAIVRPDPDVIDPRFLYYVLRDDVRVAHAHTRVVQSVQANFSLAELSAVEVPLPPLPEQRAIAHILGTLDDKIELNRRMSETLEAMARALFKSWFVDFEPVRAKMEGRWQRGQSLPGLPAHLYDLFPDRLVDSELGEIPEGWEVGTLGDIADVNWGDTKITKTSYVENGYPAYSAKGQDGYLPYYDFNRTGVVVSAIGANSGATWLALGKWSCIKNTLRFWATSEDVSTEYLFFATYGNEKWPIRGSAQPFIAQGDAKAMKILIPQNKLAIKFAEIVRLMIEKKKHNDDESRTLAALRDALLPKLICGEIRVRDAERFLEERGL